MQLQQEESSPCPLLLHFVYSVKVQQSLWKSEKSFTIMMDPPGEPAGRSIWSKLLTKCLALVLALYLILAKCLALVQSLGKHALRICVNMLRSMIGFGPVLASFACKCILWLYKTMCDIMIFVLSAALRYVLRFCNNMHYIMTSLSSAAYRRFSRLCRSMRCFVLLHAKNHNSIKGKRIYFY